MEKKKNRPSKRVLMRRVKALTTKNEKLASALDYLTFDLRNHTACSTPLEAVNLYRRRKELVIQLNDSVRLTQMGSDEKAQRIGALEGNVSNLTHNNMEQHDEIVRLMRVNESLNEDVKVQSFIIFGLFIVVAVLAVWLINIR